MRNFKYTLHLFAAVLFLGLSSCAKSPELPNQGGEVVEGEPAILSMSFSAIEMELSTKAGMSDEKEKEINSIAVFIFDKTGHVISQTIHENAGDLSSSGSVLRPNGTDYINIETYTGNDHEIFVVANYLSNLIPGLRSVATVSDMNKLVISMLGNPMTREFGICKIAHMKNQKIRKQETIKAQLEFVSAKITVKVINKCPDIEINGWTAENIPVKSYVSKRDPISSDPTYHDASKVINNDDFHSDFANQNFQFEILPKLDGPGSSVDPKEYSTTFYMYENRRGKRVSKQLPPGGWVSPNPETDYRLKSWFAPEKATIVRIYGRIKGQAPKSFKLNHYLGADNYSDYNIARGGHYTYTITINGIDDIDIDTNIDQSDLSLEIRPPTDLDRIDSHASTRPFLLYTNEIFDSNIKISAEVLETVGSLIHPDWLDLTTVSTTVQHVRKNSDPLIAAWQQEGENNTYIRPKFIPNKKTRAELGNYTPPVGVMGIDYDEDDTSMPYAKAHHRMCKKLTELPTKATLSSLDSPLAIFLYVDEFPYSSTHAYREAVIRFSIEKPGVDGIDTRYVRFLVRQYPPYISAAAPDNRKSILLVERIEEYERATHSNTPISLQIGAGMQWGKFDLPSANNIYNGANNTLLGVYKDLNIANYYNARNFVKKYGSLSGGWQKNNDAEIQEGAGVSIPTIGAPYNNVPAQDYDNAYNSIYNMTAARYCHEKNRDINGDGNIDQSETFWYLPSVGELQLFWTYREVLKTTSDFYWSSTQTTNDKAYAISMLHEASSPKLIYNGVPVEMSKTYTSTMGPPRVRCVRRVDRGAQGADPMHPFVIHRTDGATVIDCSNLTSTMYTTVSRNNLSQGNNGAIIVANEKVFKKFEVQRTENDLSDYNSLYIGEGKCNRSNGWRMPTQREMLLIYSVKDELESNTNFAKFDKGLYWTMSRDLDVHYMVNFNNGLAEHGTYFDHSYKFGYRCVKEMP